MVKGSATLYAKLRTGDPISGHLPSVDALFASAAECVGAQAVGILLTGMGQDGAAAFWRCTVPAPTPSPRTKHLHCLWHAPRSDFDGRGACSRTDQRVSRVTRLTRQLNEHEPG